MIHSTQEQDTCRICGGPAEEGQPLFYPCKCSGTIRYIHQDCLKTWLNHSKKTTCDVCKHPYAFTKIYAPDAPDRVPVTILVRKFAEQVAAVSMFMLRATLVAFVWLTLLPYGTVLTWRLYFRMGDVIAWGISLHRRPDTSDSTIQETRNQTLTATPTQDISFQPYLRNISTDIFTGQIIASLIVLAFLAVFLLREWIQQNALPGVFEEAPVGDIPGAPQPAPQPQEVGGQIQDDRDQAAGTLEEAAVGMPVPEPQADPHPETPPPEEVPPIDSPPSPASSSSSSIEGSRHKRPAYARAIQPPSPPTSHRRRHANAYNLPRHRFRKSFIEAALNQRRREIEEKSDTPSVIKPSVEAEASGEQRRELQSLDGFPSQTAERGSIHSDTSSEPSSMGHKKRKAQITGPEYKRRAGPFGTLPPSTHSEFEFTFRPSGVSTPQSPPSVKTTTQRNGEPSSVKQGKEFSSFGSPTSRTFEFTFRPPQSSPSTSSSSSHPFESPEEGVSNQISSEQERGSSPVRSLPPSFQFTFRAPDSSPRQSPPPNQTSFKKNEEFKFDGHPTSESAIIRDSSSRFDGHFPEFLQQSGEYVVPTGRSSPPSPEQTDTSSSQRSSSPTGWFNLQPSRRSPSVTESTIAEASSSTVTTDADISARSPRLASHPSQEHPPDGEHFPSAAAPLEDPQEEDELEDPYSHYFEELDGTKEFPQQHSFQDTDEDEDEDYDVQDAEDIRDMAPQADVDPNAAAQDAPGPEAEAAELADEERDQNLEEDLDGAMEAIGLRGPVFAVFQNASLMLFILNVSIGGGIWLPFTLGKTAALLSLEPRRSLQILHLPIRAVRLVTDPSVDGFVYVLRMVSSLVVELIGLIFVWILRSLESLYGKKAEETLSLFFRRINLHPIATFFMNPGDKDKFSPYVDNHSWWKMSREKILDYSQSFLLGDPKITSFAANAVEHPTFQLAEEKFTAIGRRVRVAVTSAWKGWVAVAEGDGTVEKISAILLGYAIAAFLAALYLNTFTVGNVKSAGRAVRNAIRQQMIVMKVALFIIVELVMFPLGCGVMLDFSTLAMFPEASVKSRMAFFFYAPITAAFYHWLIGTMFMYQFAILLATCREILRPGCMWFIKDPQDPTFHPIRDILDRPTLAQLRKLFMSAIMYAFVIMLGVGSIAWSLPTMAPSVLPLRWKMREPLWEIPVDLLVVHLVLPPTLHYFRPKTTVRRLMTSWWRWAARQLRLTSFMFGDRHPLEEYTSTHWSWRKLFENDDMQLVDLEATRDGGFRRVPAGDNIAFVRDKPTLVEVDESGTAVDEEGNAIIRAQNAEAQQAGRNYQDDYTVVYVPPRFRERIFAFILFFWLSGSFSVIAALFIPILLGRGVFGLFSPRHVHDGYSFAVGFYLLWWGWLMGSLIAMVRVRRQRHAGSRRSRASWLLFLFKRICIYCAKILWMGLWLGFVLPTLVSVAVDLYLVIPMRHFINPDFTPRIHILESWATGLILSKIIVRTHRRTRPGGDLAGALEAIRQNGWMSPDPLVATRDFIIPVGVGLVGMILIPPLVLVGCHKVIALPWPLKDLFRLVYPSIFVVVTVFQFAMSLVGVFTKWTQGIRDKEFLVELRLRNLENPRKMGKAGPPEVESAEQSEEIPHEV